MQAFEACDDGIPIACTELPNYIERNTNFPQKCMDQSLRMVSKSLLLGYVIFALAPIPVCWVASDRIITTIFVHSFQGCTPHL